MDPGLTKGKGGDRGGHTAPQIWVRGGMGVRHGWSTQVGRGHWGARQGAGIQMGEGTPPLHQYYYHCPQLNREGRAKPLLSHTSWGLWEAATWGAGLRQGQWQQAVSSFQTLLYAFPICPPNLARHWLGAGSGKRDLHAAAAVPG